jgi:hypothetical protein
MIFVIGFAVAVKSVFTISEQLIDDIHYKYLLTYKLSQDHLEIFFSKIRQRFGHNNNPNVMEFRTSMKQMLLKNSVTSSYTANCIAFDSSCEESVFEIRWSKRKSGDVEKEEESILSDIQTSEYDGFGVIKENILYYICGFIVRKILIKLNCLTCYENLLEKFNEHNYFQANAYSTFVNLKNRGGLVKCSDAVLKIVRFVEKKLLELTCNFVSLKCSLKTKIIIYARNYVYNFNIFENESCPDDSFLENHRLELVSLICNEYLKIRLHYVAKSKTNTIISKRRLLTKLILFNNQ